MFKNESELKNIYLCGFSFSGKTTTGKILARLMKKKFIDTDAVIAGKRKNSAGELLSRIGEKKFRKMEKALIEKLVRRKNLVVALGGGILPNPGLLSSGICIFLNRSFPLIASCLSASSCGRPMLYGRTYEDRKKMALRLFKKRLKYYKKAQLEIKFSKKNQSEVADLIMEKLK